MAGRAACVVLLCIALFGAAYASQQQYNDGPGYDHSGPDGYHHGPDGHDDHGPDGYGYHGDDSYGHGGEGYGHEAPYEHQPESYYKALKLNLQEERVKDVDFDIFTWTSVLKCAEDEKTHPAQCFEEPGSADYNNYGYGNDDRDFMSQIIQEPAGECVFKVTRVDIEEHTVLFLARRVDITCTLMSSAEKCGYGLPSGATFNATGYMKACKAVSCDQDWASTGFNGVGGGRKLLADNTADYSRVARNGTVYQGDALLVEAHVTSCIAGHHHELAEKLHNAKLEYVGGFVNGVKINETVEIGEDGYPKRTLRLPDLPFITGGSLKLTMKDY